VPDPPAGIDHKEDRMTENRSPDSVPGASFTQPGRESGSDRVKKRNAARDAAKAAAGAVRANKEVEDPEMAKAIRNARKEAGK
jgi:hypothetical protein